MTITINGGWYVNQLPNHIVIERESGELAMFQISPLSTKTEEDFTAYKGYHPRKMKGHPLPEYLYRFYGLERNQESLSEVIRVRLSPTEKERLETAAKNEDMTVSEFLRDQIRKL